MATTYKRALLGCRVRKRGLDSRLASREEESGSPPPSAGLQCAPDEVSDDLRDLGFEGGDPMQHLPVVLAQLYAGDSAGSRENLGVERLHRAALPAQRVEDPV